MLACERRRPLIAVVVAALALGAASLVPASAYGKIHIVDTVDELRAALDDAENNGTSDVIIVLPGEYEVSDELIYRERDEPCDSDLFVGGLGGPFKPVFNGHAQGSQNFLLGDLGCSGITVADMRISGGSAQIAADNNGGGLSVFAADRDVKVINCQFRNNEAEGAGGGASLSTVTGDLWLFNNIFESNVAKRGGGARLAALEDIRTSVYQYREVNIYAFNNTFWGNTAENRVAGTDPDGGGLLVEASHLGSVRIETNIFYLNAAGRFGDDLHLRAPDARVWHVKSNVLTGVSVFPEPGEGEFRFDGNTDQEPGLDGYMAPQAPGFPEVDGGPHPDNPFFFHPPQVYDYRAHSRYVDGDGDGVVVVDMGAIEYQPRDPPAPPAPPPPESRRWHYRVVPDVPAKILQSVRTPEQYLRIGDVAMNCDQRIGWTIAVSRLPYGTFSLHYGDPESRSYRISDGPNRGSITLPPMRFDKGDRPSLSFLLYMDTRRSETVDVLRVLAGKDVVWRKTAGNTVMKRWQRVNIDLSPYAGTEVEVRLEFDTRDGGSEYGEGVYVEEIMVDLDGRQPSGVWTPPGDASGDEVGGEVQGQRATRTSTVRRERPAPKH
jgi:hypothetical protein